MKALPDLTGQKFNKLRIKRMLGFDDKHHTLCLCECECGGETIERAAEVQSGHVKSCGCLQKNRKPDLLNRRFGRLVAKRFAGKDSRGNRVYDCDCDCGGNKTVAATLLIGGYVESCGCLLAETRNENLAKAHALQIKHGLSGTQVYRSWSAMVSRCFDTGSEIYSRYGARGITVCDGLHATPQHLLDSIGEPPTKNHTVDRFPKQAGNYTCGTCDNCRTMKWEKNIRWATKKEQAVNRKSTVWVEIDGVRQTRSQWAKDLGIPYKKSVYLLKKYEVTTKPIEFKPPQGVVPEGVGIGEDFDLVCTFRVKASGVCLVQLGEIKLPGYDAKDKGGSKPSYRGDAEAMVNARQE
jgi:hypothetical protein